MASEEGGRELSTGQRWFPRAYALLLAANLLLIPLKAGYGSYVHPVTWALIAAFAGAGGWLVRMVWRWTAVGAPHKVDEPPRMGWAECVLAWVVLVLFVLYTADWSLDLGLLPVRAR
jgi:hypothetical protein